MIRLIIGIIAIPIILSKYYDWIVKKEKLDFKTIMLLLLATLAVAQVMYERFISSPLDN